MYMKCYIGKGIRDGLDNAENRSVGATAVLRLAFVRLISPRIEPHQPSTATPSHRIRTSTQAHFIAKSNGFTSSALRTIF